MKTEAPKNPATAPLIIGLFTEDGLDQICTTESQAFNEKRDLRAMGCTVNAYHVVNESDLDRIDSYMRDGVRFATARDRVEQENARARREAKKTPAELRAEAEEVQTQIVNTCGHGKRARLQEKRLELLNRADSIEGAAAVESAQATAQAGAGLICPPATLNGYPVTAIQDHKNGFFTVMVIRDAHAAPNHARLAVATWWHGLGESWSWGHYIDGNPLDCDAAQTEAESTFKDVAKRNARRAPVAHLMPQD